MSSKPHICKSKPHVLVPPSPYAPRSSASGVQAEKPKQRTGRPKQTARAEPIPEPLWTRLPTSLNYHAAQERMNLREFLLRFSHLSEIARGHLEELEEVGSGTLGYPDPEKECSSVSESRLATWISEPALKGIFVGLLTILSRDSELDGEVQVITKAIQGIKAAGVNLNKIWAALAALRENSSVVLPDPLPRPASITRLGTSSVALAQDASHSIVLYTAQLVPAVSALTDRMLQTKMVREDFDRAAAQEKDLSRAARELTAEENKRWKVLFDAKDGTRDSRRATRTAHKDALTAIEHAHKVAMTECLPRFAPLGRDADGRVYFVLSPGMIEREAAVDLLEGGRGEVKWGKRRGIADEAQRKRMRYWSWHLAVWGRKPKGAHVAKVARGEDAEDDEESEGWWGFWEPTEVAKLSEWLAAQYGIEIETKNASKDAEGVPIDEATKVHPTAAQDSEGKARGRPSNASSTADTSAEASSSRIRTFASLNRESSHDDHEDVRTSDSDDGDDSLYSRVDSRGQPVPRRQDLIALVWRLREYADLLNWRIKRASKESKEGAEKAEGSDKGKAVRKEEAIPTQTFYGK
ncbi:hypothetical protein BN946_scf185042.g125 [Trametes cinnabarina]|uniref:Uncharacterized protein n=1 Tax=Pycnoporus cinnabarinus TaxID=5643 RepID=A0A060SA08_PYCCI|nr:hypothetical protein BN946_scf185042.g125 [Trametes cinnabarina]